MKRDKFVEICMNDLFIFVLGDVWFMKNIDNKRKRKYYFSFYMMLVVCSFQKFGEKNGCFNE